MTEKTRSQPDIAPRAMLNKVPEITAWFWVIKILCTTVGESFADWINMTLGVGLINTALIFSAVLAAVLAWQLRLDRYVPFVYWLTVVVLSVTGTLYTDILTDSLGVPLGVSTSVFAALLAVVFAVWFARERTLSIHSIVTTPRELFYWLAVLVTFALGTAVGDWILELTGWGPGISVLLPAALIAAIVIGWRGGANSVLSFWLAYILTRPLGANLGDWLATPTTDHGLGLGAAVTSVVFLAAIAVTVLYLTRSRVDVIAGEPGATSTPSATTRSVREHAMLGYYMVIAAATGAVLIWAAGQPHQTAAASDEEAGAQAAVATALTPGQATAHFPPADVSSLSTIAQDTLAKLQSGDQAGATARVKDLETTWDDRQSTLQPLDGTTWTALDGQIDHVLTALRTDSRPHGRDTIPHHADHVAALSTAAAAMIDPEFAQAHLFVALLGEHLREMAPKLAAADRAAVGRTALAQTRRHQAHQLRRDINHARFLIERLLHRFPEIDATGLDAVMAEAQRLGKAGGGAPVGAGAARSAAPTGTDGR